MTEPWGPLVRQGANALVEGRFGECERLAGQAAALAPGAPEPDLLLVTACRERGRAAEAEILVREVLARAPGSGEAQALLGAILLDLGRDSEARRQLDVLGPGAGGHPEPVAVLAVEVAAALDVVHHAEALHARLAGQPGRVAGCHGTVSRHLGLLCHALGRWDEAEAHFDAALEANRAAGAPVLVAHTRRHYSALLRARGEEGDWERAIELLAQAATIYRRLEIERLAEEAEVVLRRSQELAVDAADAVNLFRRTGAGWELAYGGQRATVAHTAGLGHIAALLGAEGRPLHAVDLAGSTVDGALGAQVAREYQVRLAEIEAQMAEPDPLAAALARAERDFLRAELAVVAAGRPPAAEVGDRARRLIALRIRSCLDTLDDAAPALARHLRRSIRTGTFCLYEPARAERWDIRV